MVVTVPLSLSWEDATVATVLHEWLSERGRCMHTCDVQISVMLVCRNVLDHDYHLYNMQDHQGTAQSLHHQLLQIRTLLV